MEPFTRDEIYMAAAGEYDGELPEPVTRPDYYWIEIIERINAGASVDPEEINAAIADYLNTHDADIVTEAELAEALNEKQDALTAGDNISIETVNGELTISATDTTYSDATQQTHGLMSTAQQSKIQA